MAQSSIDLTRLLPGSLLAALMAQSSTDFTPARILGSADPALQQPGALHRLSADVFGDTVEDDLGGGSAASPGGIGLLFRDSSLQVVGPGRRTLGEIGSDRLARLE